MSLINDFKRKVEAKKRNTALNWEETKQNLRREAVEGQSAAQDRERELHISGKVLDNSLERYDEIEFSQKVSEAQMMLQNSGDRIIDSLQKAKNDYFYWETEDDSPMKRKQMNQIRKNEKMLLYRLGLVEEAKLDLENMTDAHRYEKAMKDLVYGYKMINSISANAGWTTKLALWFQRKKAKVKLDSVGASAMEAKMNANNTAADDEWESIDDYVNIKTLHLLSHKKKGVHVVLFTENGFGRPGFLTSSEVTDFENEYPTLQIKPNQDCHDRFIVLDYGTKDEKVFHCGASSKDAGKKVCAINAIEDTALIHPVIDNLMSRPDKTI